MRRAVQETHQHVRTNPKEKGAKHGNDSLKAQEWLVQNQESTIVTLQNQIANLSHQMATLRVENHVLRVKNGQVQQEMMRDAAKGGVVNGAECVSSDVVRRALLEWGDVAIAVGGTDGTTATTTTTATTATTATTPTAGVSIDTMIYIFCHDLMVWSVQRWIGGRSGADLVLEGPGCLLGEVVECDHAWCLRRVDAIVAFMESMLCVYSMRGAMERVVRRVLSQWCGGSSREQVEDCPADEARLLANALLTRFVSSDNISYALLMREACRTCLGRLQELTRDVLGVAHRPEQGQTKRTMQTEEMEETEVGPSAEAMASRTVSHSSTVHDAYTLLDLIWVCDACISRLGAAEHHAVEALIDEALLRGVASDVFDISQQCEVVASILPDVALSGKRLQCQLVAALQRMERAEYKI